MRQEPADRPDNRAGREDVLFMEELRRYHAAGVEITLKDTRLPLEDIVRICAVRERGAYMCDFVADEENHIIRINLDDVRENDICEDGICGSSRIGSDIGDDAGNDIGDEAGRDSDACSD